MARLSEIGVDVFAYSRKPHSQAARCGVVWCGLNAGDPADRPQQDWLCFCAIDLLPQYFPMLERLGARRVVALSSTSIFTKSAEGGSCDIADIALAQRLKDGERLFKEWASVAGIAWTILRPTLIYDLVHDKNVFVIAKFIRRFGFFPLLGHAQGLRQPIHADDVAAAAWAVLGSAAAAGRAYNISGGETLTYRDMVARIFEAQGRRPRFIQVPLAFFRLGVTCLRRFPRYAHWTVAMAQRMNRDLVFDHSDATRDFGFKARAFVAD